MSDFELEVLVEQTLAELAVPAHLSGTEMLKTAVLLVLEDPSYIHSVTARLYPDVAKKLNSTPARAERSIRTAVESCCSRCSYNVLQRYFGASLDPESGKMTNSEFIAKLAWALRRKMRDDDKEKA